VATETSRQDHGCLYKVLYKYQVAYSHCYSCLQSVIPHEIRFMTHLYNFSSWLTMSFFWRGTYI